MRRGDSLRDELEEVYRSRYRQFLRVATAIAGDEASGHDAVQDGFAQALRAERSFRNEGSVDGWVWRTVVNAALASRRRSVARRESSATVEAVDANGHAADESPVRAWVAALPERQRLAVYLRYYADLDYRTIAAALGVEIGTVSATLSSAHETLRRSLQEVER
jgi:RNA polymerase sigma factor (sigma-70 family)